MFCPNCAAEDRTQSQYCRACGAELHIVRTALQHPDAITSSAISARDEIGRTIAAKIREMSSSRDLKRVAEDVLPKVEKFLESPEERRMRHFREGVITAATGAGILLFLLVCSEMVALNQKGLIFFLLGVGGGIISLLVGLGLIISARWFTVPPKELGRAPQPLGQFMADEKTTGALQQDQPSTPSATPASVTEGTTRQLR